MTITDITPGLVAGTWTIDADHSDIGFTARHLMTKVRGRFAKVAGEIVVAENPLESRATAEIDVASVDTGSDTRDNHLRTSDFFAVEEYPTITFRSTGLREHGADYLLDGELTIKGITRPVTLEVEVNGVGKDPWGGTRAGFTGSVTINRKDYGVTWNAPVDGGGFLVGDKVAITLEVQAVLQES